MLKHTLMNSTKIEIIYQQLEGIYKAQHLV